MKLSSLAFSIPQNFNFKNLNFYFFVLSFILAMIDLLLVVSEPNEN